MVGPSGAGKDSLLDLARRDLAHDDRFVFARRVVTRIARHEDHETLTPEEFAERKAAGGFLLDWCAHGLCYGLPMSLRDELNRGRIIVANVSRAVVPSAEAICTRVLVLHVTAPAAVLARRIAARGRETSDDIEMRLAREAELVIGGGRVETICNDGSLAQGAHLFKAALLDFAASARSETAV